MHNLLDETHRASCLRENLTSSSYGEGLETDRTTSQVPRQSLTRQLKYDGFRSLAIIQSGRCELISRNRHPLIHSLIYERDWHRPIRAQRYSTEKLSVSTNEVSRGSMTCSFTGASLAFSHSIC